MAANVLSTIRNFSTPKGPKKEQTLEGSPFDSLDQGPTIMREPDTQIPGYVHIHTFARYKRIRFEVGCFSIKFGSERD